MRSFQLCVQRRVLINTKVVAQQECIWRSLNACVLVPSGASQARRILVGPWGGIATAP